MLMQHRVNVDPLLDLMAHKGVQRMAGFGSSEFMPLSLFSLD